MTRSTVRASGAALLVLIASLVLIPLAGHAQVPQTISYQGALSDSAGAPVAGPVAMTFSLWDSPEIVGATLLWQEALDVAVTNGAFEVLLGADAGNELPTALFEDPLYLGIAVGGDAEMTPRQALAAVGYALRAKTVEVDTLNALSCTVGQLAKWNGAAWDCEADEDTDTLYVAGAGLALSGTTFSIDTSGVTGSMIAPSAVTEGKLAFDTATQTELDSAVVAIGPHVTSVDGLSGGTINSSVTVSGTMSATDVAVSSTALVTNLNADRLDSLQAAEIVAAAQDEVRTAITSLPFTITTPGSYYLTGDLASAGNGIVLQTDDVTIDLMGYSLIGPGGGANYGVDMATYSNVEIRNGTIRNFGFGGVRSSGTATGNRVIGMRIVGNTSTGISMSGGTGHQVTDSLVANNVSGIFLGAGALIARNTASNNGSVGMSGGAGSTVTGNSVWGNGNNGIQVGAGSVVTGNAVDDSGWQGIVASLGSTVTGNTVSNASEKGIRADSGSTVSGNTAYNNGTEGIWVSVGVTVTGNTAYLNQNEGIYLTGGDFVDGNTALSNNQSGGGFANIRACASCTFGANHAP